MKRTLALAIQPIPRFIVQCGICERRINYPRDVFFLIRRLKKANVVQLVGSTEEDESEKMSICWKCKSKIWLPRYYMNEQGAERDRVKIEAFFKKERSLRSIPCYTVKKVRNGSRILIVDMMILEGTQFIFPPTIN